MSYNNKTRYRVLFLLPLLQIFIGVAMTYGAGIPDSIHARIQSCEGKIRLEAYATACMQLAAQNNVEEELCLLHAYQAEAARQGDAKHETQARTYRLYAFYNTDLSDSLDAYLPDDLRFMQKNEQWTFYYSCWSLRVERMQYDKKLQSALRESQRMYDDATRRRNPTGQGISAYLIASCYQSMERNEEAADFFLEAEKYLSDLGNTGQLHNLYGMAWQSLSALGRYDEQLALVERWKAMWDKHCKQNEAEPSSFAPYYIVCYLAAADARIGQNHLPEARKELDNAHLYAEGTREIVRLLLLKEEALYEEACGNYARALEYVDRRYRLQLELDNRLSAIETLEVRASLLSKLGRHEEATRLYEKLLPQKDSLSRMDLAAQLDDLGILYKVDALKLEKEHIHYWLVTAVVGCALLLLLLAGYIYHNHRLKQKNKILSCHILEEEKRQREAARLQARIPADELSREEELFQRLNEKMWKQKLFINPSLARKELSDLMGTNETYLADAIRKCTDGMTVKEYITSLRLKYVCHLLSTRRELTVDAAGDMAGFNSRSTYFRLFREAYGLTPTEFRRSTL